MTSILHGNCKLKELVLLSLLVIPVQVFVVAMIPKIIKMKKIAQPIFMVLRKSPSLDFKGGGAGCSLIGRPHEGHVGAWSEICWLQSGQVVRGMGGPPLGEKRVDFGVFSTDAILIYKDRDLKILISHYP